MTIKILLFLFLCIVTTSCYLKQERPLNEKNKSGTILQLKKDSIINLSTGLYEIKKGILYKEKNTRSINFFKVKDLIYDVELNVVYNIEAGLVFKTIQKEKYITNSIGIISRVKGDKKEPFVEMIEDSIVLELDLNNTMVMGSDSDLLFKVKKVLYPLNKYEHLVSSYILVLGYIDSESKIFWGNLTYIREKKQGYEYNHYGYSLIQRGNH